MKRLVFLPLIAFAALTVGCRKAPKPVDTQPAVDNRNTNYQPGAGVAINTIKAGKRTAAMHDFDQLKTIIYAMELENNRMPSKEELRTELGGNGKNLLKLIDDGAILVPTQPRKDGLWAYEIDADKAEGNGVGVQSTPAIYLNGVQWEGPAAAKFMKMWVDEELALNR